jgi:hypothetical protein
MLLHELAHAFNTMPLGPDGHYAFNSQYDNVEEKRVEIDFEQVVARELHEPVRTTHSIGTTVVFGVGVTDHTTR